MSSGDEHSFRPDAEPIASVVIPAHDEEAVIGRLLSALIGHRPGRFEIIVVCNGCSDGTAAVASSYGPAVRVVELAEPSKRLALATGDEAASCFPRLYVDADVVLSADSAEALVLALGDGSVHAVAPERSLPRDGVSRFVRWYYDVWEQLPQVRSGLFGRGVIGVSGAGNARIRALPAAMGDDLVASEAFEPHERRVVAGAEVEIRPPRTVRDLHRRRVRASTGNVQADRMGLRRRSSSTSMRTLLDLAREHPRLAVKMPVFLATTAAARVASRRAIRSGDFDTWLRDESSRQDP